MKRLATLITFCLMSVAALAQNITVEGTVLDDAGS